MFKIISYSIFAVLMIACSGDPKVKQQLLSTDFLDNGLHTQNILCPSERDCNKRSGSHCEMALLQKSPPIIDTIGGMCPLGFYRPNGNCLPYHREVSQGDCRFDPFVSRLNLTVEGPGEVSVRGDNVLINGNYFNQMFQDQSIAIDFHGNYSWSDFTLAPGNYSIFAYPDAGATAKFSGDCLSAVNNYFQHDGDLRGHEHNCTITFLANTTPPVDVNFGVTVKEQTTYARIENALVTIAGRDCSTDSWGDCVQMVPPGSQLVRVSKIGYKTYSQNYNVTRSAAIVVFLEPDIAPPPPESLLTITVSDSITGQRIAGAGVNLGFGTYYADSQGVMAGNVPHGSYAGTASKAGYQDKPVSVTVNGPTNLDIALVPIAHSPRDCTDELGGTRAHGDQWLKDLPPRREAFPCDPGTSGTREKVFSRQQPMVCNDGSADPNGAVVEGGFKVVGICTPDSSGSNRSCGTTAHGATEVTYDDSTEKWENCPAPQDGSRLVAYRITITRLCTDGSLSAPNRSAPVFLSVKVNNCKASQPPPPPPPTHGTLAICVVMGDGSPLPGVTVATLSGPATGSGVTGANGCVGADIPFGFYTYRLSKDGASVNGSVDHNRTNRVIIHNAATGAVTSN